MKFYKNQYQHHSYFNSPSNRLVARVSEFLEENHIPDELASELLNNLQNWTTDLDSTIIRVERNLP